MAKHEPLYYATYKGPSPIVRLGEGAAERGYPAGSTVEVGKADADVIRKLLKGKDNVHEFSLEQVPAFLIGTAEENQPSHPGDVHDRNQALQRFHEERA